MNKEALIQAIINKDQEWTHKYKSHTMRSLLETVFKEHESNFVTTDIMNIGVTDISLQLVHAINECAPSYEDKHGKEHLFSTLIFEDTKEKEWLPTILKEFEEKIKIPAEKLDAAYFRIFYT